MRRCIWVVVILFVCGGFLSIHAGAEAVTPAGSDVTEDVAVWWQSIRGSLPADVSDEVTRFENGGEVGFEYLFGLLWREVCGESGSFFSVLFLILGVTVLGGMAGMLTEDVSPMKKPLGLLLSLATALSLWQIVSITLTRVTTYLGDLARFAEGVTPVMTAILAGGGAAGTAGTTATGMTVLLAVLEVISGRVLAPLIAIVFAFSLIGAVTDELHIDGITANLKGIFMTVLGVVGVLATGALTLQTVLSSSADTMAMRTARYTVGNMIPFVGGTIGAALGTLGSSLTVIKSSIGVGAVVACLALMFPLLVSLYLTRLALGLAASFARMMNFRVGERLLGDFRGVFDMALAVTALSGTLFLIYMAVFLRTALPFAV